MAELLTYAVVLLFVVSAAVSAAIVLCLVALIAPSQTLRDRAKTLLLQITHRDPRAWKNPRRRR